MSVDALVFDLGGVLVDVDFRRALERWATASNVPVAAIASRFRRDEAYCAHERGEMDERRYFAHLRSALGIAIADDDILAGWNAALGEPLAGIEPIVRRLAGEFPLYVFSNTNPAHIAHFAPRYRSLLSHFHRTIASCEIGSRKPEPAAFLAVAKLIGAAPGRLAFFDDLEENVAGARRARWQAYRVSRPAQIAAISERLSRAGTAR